MSRAASSGLDSPGSAGAVLLRDEQACIPLTRILSEGDLLYVFTPATPPLAPPAPGSPPEDPFEVFGKALAKHHQWVRHVPYLPRDGITSYHIAHINFAKVIIFVISGPQRGNQPSQVVLSESVRAASGHRPQIILACCSLRELGHSEDKFPTVIQISSYAKSELEAAADLLFSETPRTAAAVITAPSPPSAPAVPQRWLVEDWDLLRDLPMVHELWCQCLPDRFRVDRATLQSLLNQTGYAKNLVVRDPRSRQVVGFCTTYTTFIDNTDSYLGSLAVIVVKPSCRRRGIGLSLHNYAMRQLASHGAVRFQLGSTFPRLLYGLPMDLTSEEWFKRRGWRLDESGPGTGQEACDWLLNLNEWNTEGLSSSGLEFRACEFTEYHQVMEFVAKESVKKDNMGWYDQYSHLQHTQYIRDIMLCLEGGNLVATAIMYVPRGGSRLANDLPWPGTIGRDVGGVACICITGPFWVEVFITILLSPSPRSLVILCVPHTDLSH